MHWAAARRTKTMKNNTFYGIKMCHTALRIYILNPDLIYFTVQNIYETPQGFTAGLRYIIYVNSKCDSGEKVGKFVAKEETNYRIKLLYPCKTVRLSSLQRIRAVRISENKTELNETLFLRAYNGLKLKIRGICEHNL